MKFNEKYNISSEFNNLFSFSSEEEELEHDAQMLMFKFLNEVEKCQTVESKLKKKDLLKLIGKSPNFISQLYSVDKLLSFTLLAKIQKVFNICFEITARAISNDYNHESTSFNIKHGYDMPEGFWVWKKLEPNYTMGNECCDTFNSSNNNETAA